MKWKYLKILIQMDNEDLCILIYVVIYDMEIVFILSKFFFYCKIEMECEQVEKDFQLYFENIILEKYLCIGKV